MKSTLETDKLIDYIKGVYLAMRPTNFNIGIPITSHRKKRKKIKGYQKLKTWKKRF